MKLLCVSLLTLLGLCQSSWSWADEEPAKIHHVVIVWLKQHGDTQLRQQYIEQSKPLADLPGVLSYQVGMPANIKRARLNPAVDESYDLAVDSVFESQQAYEDFLKHPDYVRLAQEVLKPWVESYKVYDFAE